MQVDAVRRSHPWRMPATIATAAGARRPVARARKSSKMFVVRGTQEDGRALPGVFREGRC
jgi:hypothetical protein